MAFDKEELFREAKLAIENKKLFFMDEVPDFLPCSRATFYSYFPKDSDELDELKSLLNSNKTAIKQSLRQKWYISQNPTVQLALYKLLATPEELRSLSMTQVDMGGSIDITWQEERTYELEQGEEEEKEPNKE